MMLFTRAAILLAFALCASTTEASRSIKLSGKKSKSGKKTSECGPCDTHPDCWLVLPEALAGTDVEPVGYTAIARADVILDETESSQIYTCVEYQDDDSDDLLYAWKLKDVEAFLYDEHEGLLGFHFFNALSGAPRWQVGKNLVTGSLISKIPSPDSSSDNIAWLWVGVTQNNDEGILAGINRIGRYCTKAGVPPSTGCSGEDDVGNVFYSKYETSYYYFKEDM